MTKPPYPYSFDQIKARMASAPFSIAEGGALADLEIGDNIRTVAGVLAAFREPQRAGILQMLRRMYPEFEGDGIMLAVVNVHATVDHRGGVLTFKRTDEPPLDITIHVNVQE